MVYTAHLMIKCWIFTEKSTCEKVFLFRASHCWDMMSWNVQVLWRSDGRPLHFGIKVPFFLSHYKEFHVLVSNLTIVGKVFF